MKKPGGILALVLGKKGKGHDEEEPDGDEAEESEGGDDADTLFGDAFDALQDGDRKGFVKSMKAACRCL